MSSEQQIRDAAAALRQTAADLTKQAILLERAADDVASPAVTPAEVEPLAPATSDDEAAARLIALEGASSGRDRSDVLAELAKSYPSIDADALVARFFA
jgi:hypothetical protein